MRSIVLCFGTRAEALKLGPVAAELRALGVSPEIIATGQHLELLRGTPAESDLKDAYSLGLRSFGDVEDWVSEAVVMIRDRLPMDCIVVVQGDTMSAYACALAAHDLGLPIAHVEAGLRSHNPCEPNPEEYFRTKIGQIASYHFAPTQTAAHNLTVEHVKGEIWVTGNTVVSALERYASLEHIADPEQQIVVTMHRREWTDCGQEHVRATIRSIERFCENDAEIRVLFPMHPAVLKIWGKSPKKTPKNLLITPPLAYSEMVKQVRRSLGIATDSGGLSEEAATLGVPCAVLRNVTDRPESVENGVAELFPPTEEGMFHALLWIGYREPLRKPVFCFGGADSANKAAQILRELAKN